MEKLLNKIIIKYATQNREALHRTLAAEEPKDLIAILTNLLTVYFNDKNSSAMREYVTVALSGFEPNEEKIGYNGFRIGAAGETKYCEAKPQNIRTGGNKPKKLNGGGNFTDFTYSRLDRSKKENPLVLVSGFIDGKLFFVIRFPFNSPQFVNRLTEQLDKHFPEGKDISGRYLRSASFSTKDYRDIAGLETKVYVSKDELIANRKNITGPLFALLQGHAQ